MVGFPAVDGAGSVGTLVVSGPVTLAEAPRWREALLGALTEGRRVRVDLAAAGPWDLAGLQLLVSAMASARRSGWEIRLVLAPLGLLNVAGQAGLAGLLDEAIESRAE